VKKREKKKNLKRRTKIGTKKKVARKKKNIKNLKMTGTIMKKKNPKKRNLRNPVRNREEREKWRMKKK